MKSSSLRNFATRHWNWLALTVCLVPPLVETAPVWRDPLHLWAGIKWDPAQGMWWLHWVPLALMNGQNPLFTDSLNYPLGVNAFWAGPSSPLLGLIGAPLTFVGNVVLTYNALLVLGFVLTGWLTYLAASKLVRNRWPAVLAGVLVEISPIMIGHGASDLVLAFLPAFPATFLILHEVFCRRHLDPRLAGLGLALIFTLQLLISQEALAALVLGATLGTCISLVALRRTIRANLGYLLSVAVWTLLVGVVVATPVLWFQLLGPGAIHGAIPGRDAFGADLGNLLVPSRVQLLSPDALLFDPFEGTLYVGLPLAAVVVLVFATLRRRGDAVVIASTAVVVAVLALGSHLKIFGHDFGLPLPWTLFSQVPAIGDLQPQRMTLVLDFLLIFLLAIFLDELSSQRLSRLVALAAIVAWIPVFPFPNTALAVPRYFYDTVHQLPKNQVALIVPFSASWSSVDAMIWQEQSGMWFKIPEGYFFSADSRGNSVYGPPQTLLSKSLIALDEKGTSIPLDSANQQAMRDELKTLNVSVVIVGPMDHREQAVSELTTLLGCAAQEEEGVDIWKAIRNGACL